MESAVGVTVVQRLGFDFVVQEVAILGAPKQLTLSKMGFNYVSPLILGFFSINRLENFWDNCDNSRTI